MGFFSWNTQDTNESISNVHSIKPTFPVIMKDNKGNVWVEVDYDGYGVFGGKDFYELVYEMNADSSIAKLLEGKEARSIGISISLGISGIKNKITGKQFLSRDCDFFNWSEPIFEGKSPNELLESDEWENIKYRGENSIFPNLTRSKDWKWRAEQPEECEFQGFFY